MVNDDEALLVPRVKAFSMLGIGATMGHELINSGQLDARKLGDKTLITMASIKAFVAGLPKATKAAEPKSIAAMVEGRRIQRLTTTNPVE